MQAGHIVRKAVELSISVAAITTLVLAGCGGGGSGTTTPPSTTSTYTASAGVGEVMQFTINTTALTYSYTVVKTSYAASGVSAGQTGTGTLTSGANGTYTVSASSDSFIQSGKLLPKVNGLLAGHVIINNIGGAARIPVIGVSNPITQLASLAGDYNFEGFACSASGVANVAGNGTCGTNFGTMRIDAAGNLIKCNRGDITTAPGTNDCVTQDTRTLQVVSGSPGVFDFRDASNVHVGWFFAFTAANGEKVAILDNDDASTPIYGQAVLTTYASAVAADISGNYFKNDNENAERLLTISGVNISNDIGFTGTMVYNSPWSGLSTYSVASGVTVSGVAMTSGTGVYTHLMDTDPQFFASGLKY